MPEREPAPPWRPNPLQQAELVFTVAFTAILVLSVVLEPSTGGVSLFGYELPSTCLWHSLTGWRCPGCGLTRSFTFMGHGQVVQAFQLHMLGPFLYGALVLHTGWRLVAVGRAIQRSRRR